MSNVVEIVDAMMGSGKALLNGTPVVSENGYIPIDKLQVGDLVYGEDGKLHKVLGVYPQGKKQMYKVTFSDRNSITCCGDHLWTYQLPNDKAKGLFRTESLSEIMKKPLYKQTNKCKNWQFFIPVSKPVEFPKKELSIDPYLLGLFLGDGSLGTSIGFTNSEEDIQERFKNLVDGHCNIYSNKNTLGFRISSKSTVGAKLRQMFGNKIKSSLKFIPSEYKLSSVQDRWELVKGLIDTDGYCAGGYFEYCTVSERLAKDFKFVLESLGCTVTSSSVNEPKYTYKGEELCGQRAYILFIRHEDLTLLCSSKKHLKKIKSVNTKPNRSIRSIEFYGEEDCTCIMVDNPSKLFLTEHFIPTHNTTAICKWMEENNHIYKFFYISPLLEEVKDGGRIQQACPLTRFVAPETKRDDEDNHHDTKGSHLLELLRIGANITCTHNLYLNMTDEHFSEMEKHNYVLVVDEEIAMIDDYHAYSAPDVTSLIELGVISVQETDGMLIWCGQDIDSNLDKAFDDFRHKYSKFKRHVQNKMLYVSKRKDDMFVTQLPVKLITSSKRAIILTYMFEGNILSSFLKLKGIPYKTFDEITPIIPSKKEIAKLINLYSPTNQKWKKDLKLSVSAYSKMSTQDIKHIEGYILSIARSWRASSYDLLYTFPKNRSNLDVKSKAAKIKPSGLVDTELKIQKCPENVCWLASNTRATNAYRHKTCVIHAYDRYPNQSVASYLQDYGYPINADVFALSEMLQFIWRSAIRDGKPINLAILSKRMKDLFLGWLQEENI